MILFCTLWDQRVHETIHEFLSNSQWTCVILSGLYSTHNLVIPEHSYFHRNGGLNRSNWIIMGYTRNTTFTSYSDLWGHRPILATLCWSQSIVRWRWGVLKSMPCTRLPNPISRFTLRLSCIRRASLSGSGWRKDFAVMIWGLLTLDIGLKHTYSTIAGVHWRSSLLLCHRDPRKYQR